MVKFVGDVGIFEILDFTSTILATQICKNGFPASSQRFELRLSFSFISSIFSIFPNLASPLFQPYLDPLQLHLFLFSSAQFLSLQPFLEITNRCKQKECHFLSLILFALSSLI